MANQNLSDLGQITVESLTAVTSLNLFLSNDGDGRVVSAPALAAHLGYPIGAIAVRSTDFSITNGDGEIAITYQDTEYDALGYWSGAAPTRLTVPYNGWIRLFSTVRGTTIRIGNTMRYRIFKNGGENWNTTPWFEDESESSPEWNLWSAPIIVSSGDYFEQMLRVFGGSRTIEASQGRIHFGIMPLAIWLP